MANHNITNYVKQKTWDDSTMSLSFQMTDYVREKLDQVPNGTYININQSRLESPDGQDYWSMWYKA